MANRLEMIQHLSNQTLRTLFYTGVRSATNRMMGQGAPLSTQSQAGGSGRQPGAVTGDGAETGSNPSRTDAGRKTSTLGFGSLLSDLAAFIYKDAALVQQGIIPPLQNELDAFPVTLNRIRKMFEDIPASNRRRLKGDSDEISNLMPHQELPDYFVQNFHYQTGGYLTGESARLYDVQVETLFYGLGNAMRRQALRPISEFLQGRDQREVRLLDVACGTGRFLAQLKQAYPALPVTGLDLSFPYLLEARRYLRDRRSVSLIKANGEDLPFSSNSLDIVTSIFLFHEIPDYVRRIVAAEVARVLRPGGIFIMIDSLQLGDRQEYDGLLKMFPARFHEPFYGSYISDDLETAFTDVGLMHHDKHLAFLSKVMTRQLAC